MALLRKTSDTALRSERELRKIIPPYPKLLDKRIVPALDHYCMEIIHHSQIAILGTSSEDIPATILATETLRILNGTTIEFDLPDYEMSSLPNCYASLYFLVPGVGHGLRVNGTLEGQGNTVRLNLSSAYVHCARAAARSELWRLDSLANVVEHRETHVPACFLEKSPFAMLKTMNLAGQTELSPRGDQPGFIKLIAADTLFIPERPGNKVAVSLRNILQNEVVELLMMIPGCNTVMVVGGRASLTVQTELLDMATVSNKRPRLGIVVESCRFSIRHSAELGACNVWLAGNQISEKDLTRFPKVLSAHMHGEGVLGMATTAVVHAIVKKDLQNLY